MARCNSKAKGISHKNLLAKKRRRGADILYLIWMREAKRGANFNQ
jgi:hypothetical protein